MELQTRIDHVAGGIDVRHEQQVGLLERSGELFREISCPAVPVWLKQDHEPPVPALFRRSQRRPNLGGVMAIIIHDHDAGFLASQMKPPFDAAERG